MHKYRLVFLAAAIAVAVALVYASRAADINASVSLSYSKSNATVQASESISVNTSTTYFQDSVVSVGTNDEAIALGDVATVGYVMVRNMTATSTNATPILKIGADGTNYWLKLKAGEVALFRWAESAIHAVTDTNGSTTSSINAQFRIFSD